MYAKGGSKKIWHEMITFVCDSKTYTKMNKYNIVSIFLGLTNYNVIFQYDFHKVHMYATHTIVVMEAGANACVLAQMHLKVKTSTFMNKPLIMNKIHYIIVRSDLIHVHAKCGN
jgi:hypothetical protein